MYVFKHLLKQNNLCFNIDSFDSEDNSITGTINLRVDERKLSIYPPSVVASLCIRVLAVMYKSYVTPRETYSFTWTYIKIAQDRANFLNWKVDKNHRGALEEHVFNWVFIVLRCPGRVILAANVREHLETDVNINKSICFFMFMCDFSFFFYIVECSRI